MLVSVKVDTNPPQLDTREKENKLTDVNRYKSGLRQVKIVLRRLSIDQKVETARKRKLQDDQSKIPEFVDYSPECDKYFTTHEQSDFPRSEVPNMNIDTLGKKVKVESNNYLEDSIIVISLDEDSEQTIANQDMIDSKSIHNEKQNVKCSRNNKKTTFTVKGVQKKNSKSSKKSQKVICPR